MNDINKRVRIANELIVRLFNTYKVHSISEEA
jgi:hypothetical protein